MPSLQTSPVDVSIQADLDHLCAAIRCPIFTEKQAWLAGTAAAQHANPAAMCDAQAIAAAVERLEVENCTSCRLSQMVEWLRAVGGTVQVPVD